GHIGTNHPLSAPYDIQILAAYMLRTFVFELADYIARMRSPHAVPLDNSIKRYLGVGNSAGLGLVPFIMKHPQLVHHWCHAQEQAFAEALSQCPDHACFDTFDCSLTKAISYFQQDNRSG